tara:strand:- start:361 stop:513 length:153 start_codon:yes stop_codon:yes gene_type:complete
MPLPSKQSAEKRSAFMRRCMSDKKVSAEFTDPKQRAAVCYSQYDKKKKKK